MEETEELKQLLHLDFSKEERKVLFDKIDFDPISKNFILFKRQRAWFKTKQVKELDSENKDFLMKSERNERDRYFREKALIEKFLLPLYFRPLSRKTNIYYQIMEREMVLKKNLFLSEARKKAKEEEPYDQLPKKLKQNLRTLQKQNEQMVANASVKPLLTPYEYFELQEKKKNKKNNNDKVDSIETKWKQLADEAKQEYKTLAHNTNKHQQKMTIIYQLTHISELKEVPYKRNYLQIYIDKLYYNSLDVKPIKYTELEIVNEFENLDANIRMKYIRKAHKESLIKKYIIYKIKQHNHNKKEKQINYDINKICNNRKTSPMSLKQLLSEEEKKEFVRNGWKELVTTMTDFTKVKKPILNKKLKLNKFKTRSYLSNNIDVNKTLAECTNEEKEIITEIYNKEKEVYERQKKHFDLFGYCYQIDALNKKGLENTNENNEQAKSKINIEIDEEDDNDDEENKETKNTGNNTD